MSRTCRVCSHKKRNHIERAIVSGAPLKRLARDFAISRASLARHRDAHLPQVIVQAKAAEDMTHAEDLVLRLEALLDDAQRIRANAENARDYRAALLGVRDMARINEILLEVRGELNRNPQINVVVSAQWVTLRTAILQALDPYPDARAAVATVLSNSAQEPK